MAICVGGEGHGIRVGAPCAGPVLMGAGIPTCCSWQTRNALYLAARCEAERLI